MRIVGGTMRGRVLKSPSPGSSAIRPTSDRARESLFNILMHGYRDNVEGGRVLDLFAGTGALGFEALSRGAVGALFVDMSIEARALIRENMHALGVQGIAKLFRRDATKIGPAGNIARFDLVFADPPYGKGLGEAALIALRDGQWLNKNALIIVEEAASAHFSLPDGFTIVDERPIGDTIFRMLRTID